MERSVTKDTVYGGKKTRQKAIIYEEMKKLDHPSATMLYDVIKDKYPSISRATVFRVLLNFAKEGAVRRLEFCDEEMRYDWNTSPHQHCRCRKCGRVFDCRIPETEKMTDGAFLPEGFKSEYMDVQFIGICADCAKNKAET